MGCNPEVQSFHVGMTEGDIDIWISNKRISGVAILELSMGSHPNPKWAIRRPSIPQNHRIANQ